MFYHSSFYTEVISRIQRHTKQLHLKHMKHIQVTGRAGPVPVPDLSESDSVVQSRSTHPAVGPASHGVFLFK